MLTTYSLSLFLLALTSHQEVLAQDDVSSENSYQLRLNLSDLSIIDEVGTSVTCTNCYINGDLSLSASLTGSPPDSNFSSLPFDFSQVWAAAVLEDFTAHFELDFIVTKPPSNQSSEASQGLIPNLTEGISFDPLFGVGWTFNPTIHTSVNTSTPVNFSYGFEFTIPANSAVFVPLDNVHDSSSVQTVGLNETKITPLNYTSSDANDDFAFELSFRPEFEIALQVAGVFDFASVTLFADLPKLDIKVNQVYNVTRDCQPAPAGTSPRLVFEKLTHVVPTSGYDVGFEGGMLEELVGEDVQSLGNRTLQTSCLFYSSEAQALVAVPAENQGRRLAATGQVVALGVMLFFAIHLM